MKGLEVGVGCMSYRISGRSKCKWGQVIDVPTVGSKG